MYPYKEHFYDQQRIMYLSKKENFKERDKESGSSLFEKLREYKHHMENLGINT